MAKNPISIEYNKQLNPLEKLLSKVNRPGDFCAAGSVTAPMPQLEINGVGTVSFPLQRFQADEISRRAERAPYGRGEETIVDESVRKVWQVSPGDLRLGGKSWAGTFETILSRATHALGCEGFAVSAELYKLLLYDTGGFFVPHRDTEKAAGMFGTLVIVLPSSHSGGELVIRHAGREVSLDLCAGDVSELSYAAFYADCEHEVRPITEGNRLCLVYNLIQTRQAGKEALTAPNYAAEIKAAAKILENWKDEVEASPKIVYLLEHQYSPEGLSFSGLKNADAAVAKVLVNAAEQAGCAAHLGIVHIEEYGAAQLDYDPHYGRRRWGRRYEIENASSDDFQVIDVCDSRRYINNWICPDEGAAKFGDVPLDGHELLPAGALDNEKPDEQRVTEATGNEGASFERSYHRAAIVLWSKDRYLDVLLQTGAGAAIPYLEQRIAEARETSGQMPEASREEIAALAERVVGKWGCNPYPYQTFSRLDDKTPGRAAMLSVLRAIGNPELAERFIETVIVEDYNGSENGQLVKASQLLGPEKTGTLFATLLEKNVHRCPAECVELLGKLVSRKGAKADAVVLAANRRMAEAVVKAIAALEEPVQNPWQMRNVKPLDESVLATLADALLKLRVAALSKKACAAVIANDKAFAPDTVLVPALSILHEQHGDAVANEALFQDLWRHTVEFHLTRSEFPPKEPTDWAQHVKLDQEDHQCEDWRELQAFARDPERREHRFRVRQDRRLDLERIIRHHGLDIACKTERTGSPQTLVCTKTRWSYQKRQEQYARDLQSLRMLARAGKMLPKVMEPLQIRIEEATARVPRRSQ